LLCVQGVERAAAAWKEKAAERATRGQVEIDVSQSVDDCDILTVIVSIVCRCRHCCWGHCCWLLLIMIG
jgi:hypothetical protein